MFVTFLGGDVRADHVLGLVKRLLGTADTLAQVLAARPPGLHLRFSVPRQLGQAARVTTTVVVRQASIAGVSVGRYGGCCHRVFLNAGVNLANAFEGITNTFTEVY